MPDDQAMANTDRELYREPTDEGEGMSYYMPSVHVTEDGKIGMNVGGRVVGMTIEKWHALAWPDASADSDLRRAAYRRYQTDAEFHALAYATAQLLGILEESAAVILHAAELVRAGMGPAYRTTHWRLLGGTPIDCKCGIDHDHVEDDPESAGRQRHDRDATMRPSANPTPRSST